MIQSDCKCYAAEQFPNLEAARDYYYRREQELLELTRSLLNERHQLLRQLGRSNGGGTTTLQSEMEGTRRRALH